MYSRVYVYLNIMPVCIHLSYLYVNVYLKFCNHVINLIIYLVINYLTVGQCLISLMLSNFLK